MCGYCQHRDDSPDWTRSALSLSRKYRELVFRTVGVVLALAAVAGTLFYLLRPTDIQRAEADHQQSLPVVRGVEVEAVRQQKEWRSHDQTAAEYRKLAETRKDSEDLAALEWYRAKAEHHARVAAAASDRRDHLLRLAAEYHRLVAEAHCEILRAKEARERGTPYEVAPKVRAILKPILTNH